jgi:subtilase family protein
MVIDTGFDPSLPVFAGKVVAMYTVACRSVTPGDAVGTTDAGAGGEDDGGTDAAGAGGLPSFDDAKQEMLSQLASADDSCQLQDSLTPAPNPFLDIEADRVAFDRAIRGDTRVGPAASSPYDDTYAAIASKLPEVPFHGTATSSTVAEDNPAVKLVLVEIALGEPSEAMSGFRCFDQESIDLTVAVLSDDEVRAAYVQRPLATVDRDLAAARARHAVGLVNESFGRSARYVLEQLQKNAGCPYVDLRAYFRTLSGLEVAQTAAHAEPEVLVVQSAGNDGALLDEPGDSLDCQPGDANHLLVGSYGYGSQRSYFTNFGRCVDVYAPGENVIAHLPGDWLFPVAGTSFSAPLLTRWLSMTAPQPFDPATTRAALEQAREPNGNLIAGDFPADMLYDPSGKGYPGARSALTTADAPTPPGVMEAPDVRALHRALWPLRLVRRH